ncbi:short chain dehydrogenase [Popillia japonica]|uniref:Short chain dehydrogenase n=1 Tax=Popillia japonica TaxID=7064 RepID=A0AAW1N7X9_POPJA
MEGCHVYTSVLAVVGGITLFFLLLDTLWNIILAARALLAPFFLTHEEQNLVKRYGSWALITGCTDGIGKEYAKQLAKKGLNVILVSRSQDKLLKTANEIEQEHPVKTKIIVADFSKGATAIDYIRNEIKNLEIGILVNNVGMQYTYPMFVGEVPEQQLWDIININVGAVTMMSRILVEDMKKRKRGAIVNVSSGSELQPLPLMTVYAASKVYVRNFTRSLRYEYSDCGITIQHLSPMFINTKMNDFSRRLRTTSFFIPDAQTFAKHAVNTLGKLDCTTGEYARKIRLHNRVLVPRNTVLFYEISSRMGENSHREQTQ